MRPAEALAPSRPRRDRVPLRGVVPALSCAALLAAPADARQEAEATEEVPGAQAELSIDGYLDLRWRGRWAEESDEEDSDLFGVLAVDVESGGEHAWGFHFLGRGAWSIEEQAPSSVFYTEQDTHGELMGNLYHAYLDLPLVEGLGLARVGRMLIYETPETAHFDGAHLESAPLGPTRFHVGAFGGSSVHISEDWPSDEWLAGAYASFDPWERGNLRVDWMHFDDDARVGTGQNDLVRFGVEQQVLDELRLNGQYSILDGDARDLRLEGYLFVPEQTLTVRATYYRLIEPQTNLAYELNPYFNYLNTYQPYDQGRLVIGKAFGESFEILAGIDGRRVEKREDIGEFNRDYDRYYGTLAFPELLPLRTTLSVTGEVWDSPQNDIETWGGDLTSELDEETRASLGSYYALYKYYFDLAAERDHVRTYYGELRREVGEDLTARVRYEYEDTPGEVFHTLRLGLTWRF